MQLAIVDPARAYAPTAPWVGPLGGTQSAACYLARELALQGHTVDLYNHVSTSISAQGVTAYNWQALFADNTAAFYDALILNGRWTAEMVEALAASGRPVIGWMHEAAFDAQTIVPTSRLAAIVFVSHWQRRVNVAAVPTDVQTTVIENAMSPHVQALLGAVIEKDLQRAVYCGDIERGLRYLPAIWPAIHAIQPQLTLEVFAPRPDNALGAAIAALPGLVHYGLVDQPRLAARMAVATWHLAPNPYPETSCISLIEALALGCRSIITTRAALPETANSFATLVPVNDPDYNRGLVSVDPTAFANIALQTLSAPVETAAQRAHFAGWTWAKRAQSWIDFLAGLATDNL